MKHPKYLSTVIKFCVGLLMVFAVVSMALAQIPAGAAVECMSTGASFDACAISFDRIRQNDDTLTNPGESYRAGWFDGFVFGVAVAQSGKTFCPLSPYTQNQLSAVVAQYLHAAPNKWSGRPENLARDALASAFPCKHSQKVAPRQ